MSVRWTEEQKKVIDVRNKNVLVSAAAGSGKTAVLVERILSLVCGEGEDEKPLDVDRLLVVTFTKAAAAEMRERVGLALEKRLEADPENEHLQKQQTLIHSAQITTIDSFCQYVIRNYFHQIDLDPAFRIGDEGELKLLKGDVVQELLEEHYGAEDPEERARFTEFVEVYATGKSDVAIENLILQLYEFAVSYPYPKRWLAECMEPYRAQTEGDLERSPWMQFLMNYVNRTFADLEQEIRRMLDICHLPGGPYMYEDAVQADLLQVQELLSCRGYENIRERLTDLSFARLSTKKDPNVEEERKNQIKAFRESMKKSLKDLKEKFFNLPLTGVLDVIQKAAPTTAVLLSLTAEFADRYQEKKRLKNLADFPDLEHLALEILVEDVETGEDSRMKIVPTDAARELSARYAQIMIDEYQDSNLIQEIILNSVSRGQGIPNVFMVGDVKQSIYRFRLARPELFMEKYHTYPQSDEAAEIRIDLHKNFRSRREVLEGTNDVFEKLMTEAVGGITYDSAAALYLGAEMPEPESGINVSELLLLEKNKDSLPETEDTDQAELTDRELEAHAAADCIRRVMAEGKVWDREAGAFRSVRYGDIVILLRSLTGWGDVYARVLNAAGIPAHTESRTGYFTTIEIQTLLNLLRIVDNPRQDIPLAAVLKSMIGGFTDVELAKIKSAYPDVKFHEACRKYAEKKKKENVKKQDAKGKDAECTIEVQIQEKLQTFFHNLRTYREHAEFLPIHELIEELLRITGYGDYLAAEPAGTQREANVRMLIERAIAFEKTSYRGLFHFVRYMEQLQSYKEDFGEAGILGENENAVRIMTIHKSKGLEFPVVIVAGLGKSFNRQDIRSRVVIHPELGVGVDWVDAELRTRTASLPKRVLQKALDLEMLGEELRVLYVAFTRAKEKLILLGSAAKLEEKMGKSLSFRTISTAGTYLDWVLPAVAGSGESPFEVKTVTLEGQTEEALIRQMEKEEQWEIFAHPEELPGTDEEYAKLLEKQLSDTYPWQEDITLQGKFSVSELKKMGQTEEEDADTLLYPAEEIVPYIPRFMSEKEPISGAARGTAYHRALECLDFRELYHSEKVKEGLARLVEEGRMTQEQADVVRPYDIYAFARTPLAKRMSAARAREEFHTEQPFVIRMPARELEIGCGSDEPVLIQGIIDAWFYEKNENGENEIVVVDYKTDFVKDGGELLKKYKKQLDYYQLTLERLTGKRVKEKIIYSFCLEEEIHALRLNPHNRLCIMSGEKTSACSSAQIDYYER
ncbi:helicase-exonuclease AddAB subunit AddA [Laedolimicola intestinihominis]|uniref:ATP-dependent helicase/nuclease subunit A n=1 Tax=Laedolimicola intestinihominis TaxID=3133166 RepID=A0ABV1FHA9_9FIRM